MGAKLDTGVADKRGRLPVNSEPNVIPFIDVMLVLLIIFMVTAPIASVDIQTDMPDSEVLSSQRVPKPVWITLVDGADCEQSVKGVALSGCPAVFVMEEETGFDGLGDKTMDALRANNPRLRNDFAELIQQRVYVRASGETRYANVMRVMNRLQDEGITKIALVQDDNTP